MTKMADNQRNVEDASTSKNPGGFETVAADVDESGEHTITNETPSRDDEIHAITGTAQVDDPPVRTGRPDVPIAQTLASGTGAHTPPDPDVYDADGRPRDPNADAENKAAAGRTDTSGATGRTAGTASSGTEAPRKQ